MDLTRSHYDARNGTLFQLDQANRRIKPTKVQYANPSVYLVDVGLEARVGGLMPNIEYQTQFTSAFYAAYDEVQRSSGNLLQFDGNRLANHTGQGFVDGDMTFFVERADRVDDANYRAEFRATLSVNKYDGTITSLISYIKAELQALAVKA